MAGQSRGPCDKLATAGSDGDRHVGITPVRTIGVLVLSDSLPMYLSMYVSPQDLLVDLDGKLLGQFR